MTDLTDLTTRTVPGTLGICLDGREPQPRLGVEGCMEAFVWFFVGLSGLLGALALTVLLAGYLGLASKRF